MTNLNAELYRATAVVLRCFPQDEAAKLCGVNMQQVIDMRFGKEPPEPIPLRRCLHLADVLSALLRSGMTPLSAARWFYLPSPELSGNAPIMAYLGDWTPEEPAPRFVLATARKIRSLQL